MFHGLEFVVLFFIILRYVLGSALLLLPATVAKHLDITRLDTHEGNA